MIRMKRGLRGAVSAPIAALLLLGSVAVPVLERADFSHETVVESEHDPGRCPTPHDHTVCTQVSANHSASSRPGVGVPDPLGHRVAVPESSDRSTAGRRWHHAPARAPPAV